MQYRSLVTMRVMPRVWPSILWSRARWSGLWPVYPGGAVSRVARWREVVIAVGLLHGCRSRSGGVAGGGGVVCQWRRRLELVTTDREDRAMAAAAITGLRWMPHRG